MGVILYVLLAGFLPFEENTMIALFLKIKNADFTYPSWFSSELRKLLDKILVSDPMLRLTLAELKHHSWVAEGIKFYFLLLISSLTSNLVFLSDCYCDVLARLAVVSVDFE
jgi:serine/threonine protein kinase